MDSIRQTDLFPDARNPENAQFINERCSVRTQDGYRVVTVSGIALTQYAVGDRMAEAHAMVSLVEQGWADQERCGPGLWLLGADRAATAAPL